MHLQKWIRRTAILLILVLAAAPFAYADYAAYVSSGSLGVYSDSALGKKIGTLPKNTVVVVRSSANGVAKIACRGKTGYAASSDLKSVGGDAEEAVVGKATRVYEKPSTNSRSTAVKKGTRLTLLATSGSCAMVELGGYIGYVNKSDLLKPGETEEPEETKAPEAEAPADDLVVESFTATVTADSLAVYKTASSSSKKLATLSKGAAVSVRAYDDTWACLENNGNYGFSLRSGLERADGEPTPTPSPTPTPTPEPTPTPKPTPTPTPKPSGSTQDAIDSGKYSNEEIIFLFLTREMGLNAAAACGILSNIRSESSFRPTAYNAGGGSYGICQWTGARYTRLKNYCADKGYDYTTLIAQLFFLEYELKNHYTKTLSYMRGVENSAGGAYDAGHYWCYNFEVPANRASVSVKRGNAARDTYWPKYA